MEREKIIFFRNFFFCAFIIGVVFALFYFITVYGFWNTWASWAASVFKVDEKELGRVVVLFFMHMKYSPHRTFRPTPDGAPRSPLRSIGELVAAMRPDPTRHACRSEWQEQH